MTSPASFTPRILCFGDSNTYGLKPFESITGLNAYQRHEIWTEQMKSRLPADIELLQEGHPGRTTVLDDPVEGAHKNGAEALKILLETHQPIDVVILFVGTNDFKARFNLCDMEVALNLQQLTQIALSSNAGRGLSTPDVLLVCPPKVHSRGFLADMFAGCAQRNKDLATPLAEVAHRLDVVFFDAGGIIDVQGSDGVHFTLEEHKMLGHRMAELLTEMLYS